MVPDRCWVPRRETMVLFDCEGPTRTIDDTELPQLTEEACKRTKH